MDERQTGYRKQKLYHDLNERSNFATNTLDDSVSEVNLTKTQEVAYLTSESFQLKLLTVTKGMFQQ